MSTKGVYTALSGAVAQSLKMDTIANNIANVNTPGFKRDQQVFSEYLTANEKAPEVIQVPRVPASIESFYNMQGGDKSYVHTKGTFTDFSQGSLKATGNPLDLAIEGPGFFEVLTPQGVRFTRAGHFTLNNLGQLTTQDGHLVLKAGGEGQDPGQRAIKVEPGTPVTVNDQGEVRNGDETLAVLSLVQFTNPDSIQKQGKSLYSFREGFNPEVTNVKSPNFRVGFIESSNVNIVQEMTDMIATQRIFESTQKAISAYDQMADKTVNVVGRTTP